MNIRPPCITGKTSAERLEQVIGYLKQLPKLLELEAGSEKSQPQTALPGNLHLHQLQVRSSLTAQGGVNGVYMGKKRLWGSREFLLKTRFDTWDSPSVTRQSFLLSGSINGTPVLGTAVVSSQATVKWEGSSGVSFGVQQGGILVITLDRTCFDHFQITSPEAFRIL